MEKEERVAEFTPKEKIKNLILPEKPSLELAYFCGVLAGDGSIGYRDSKKEYCIKCVGNPKDEQEYYNSLIKVLIKRLFNLEINPKFHDKKTTYGVSIYSKSLVNYLVKVIGLPIGKKYNSLKIPEIFIKTKELARSFIRGVADTDFHLAIRKKAYPVISGVSKSESFIKEIKNFLEEDGFRVSMYKREDKDKRLNKIILTYRLELYGKKQFFRWMELIGLDHPKNQEKIKFLMNS